MLSSKMLLDLTERAKFKVTGEDRFRFLNGQLTNDILGLKPGNTRYACALTAKGKLCADLYVTSTAEALYLDTALILKSSLLTRLERYIIADDVLIEDVTDEFGLLHFLSRNVEERLKDGEGLERAFASFSKGSRLVFESESNRFAIAGVDLWFPLSAKSSILETLKEAPLTSDVAENLRIERGIAAWGNELSENVIPNEADLQDRAISYTKGCYLGQEVISRIKSIGHVNRRLRGLVPAGDIFPEQGDKLVADAQSMKVIGSITSVGRSGKSSLAIALGFVKRGHDEPGTVLQLSRNNSLIGLVEVRSLPLDPA
ncbi:MAG TPA: glycine cleavage T C-terminal barrel domain-containing protein [Chthoniobacterales bacterium]